MPIQLESKNLLRHLLIAILLPTLLFSCTASGQSTELVDPPYIFNEPLTAPRILGQKIVSTELPEFSTSFTHDGKKVHFNIASTDRKTLNIVESTFENGKWSKSVNPGSPLNSDANEVFVSMTRDGIIYFSSDANQKGRNIILRSCFRDGVYSAPEPVELNIPNDVSVGNPFISPDGHLLVFATSDLGGYGGSDLYMSFFDEESWSHPVNLGERINSPQSDFAPCISPDGKYLFFTSERPGIVSGDQVQGRPPGDIYQVDLPVIDTNQLFRNAHVMGYDEHRGKIVLFGGAGISKVYGDTWEWQNDNWIRISAAGPAPRTFAAMTYDNARQQIVMFGGNRVLFGNGKDENTFLNDTWTWDGKEWKQVATAGPSARAEAGMAFDHKRAHLVLFGGYHRSNGEIKRWGDTWEWHDARWLKMSAQGPPPQSGTTMVYDELRRVVVLWGQNAERSRGQTWEWDGQQWTQIRTADSERRYNAAMTYDKDKGKVIRFGGWDGQARTNDTWEYDGVSWTKIDTSGPAARNHSAMVYEAKNKRIVLFGGHDGENIFGDTWAFDGHHWSALRKMAPLPRLANSH